MTLLFSADRNWGIGKANRLLFRTAGDMAFFRRTTTGKVVVMGRKTLQSLPGGNPLPDRHNIVLTSDPAFCPPGVQVCRSLPALFAVLAGYRDDDIFVIGGEQVYRQLAPYAARALVTRWDATATADCFVPDLDTAPGWRLAEKSDLQQEQDLCYRFCTYLNEHPTDWRAAYEPSKPSEPLV